MYVVVRTAGDVELLSFGMKSDAVKRVGNLQHLFLHGLGAADVEYENVFVGAVWVAFALIGARREIQAIVATGQDEQGLVVWTYCGGDGLANRKCWIGRQAGIQWLENGAAGGLGS